MARSELERLDYLNWPHCGLHSARTERMTEKSAVTPSAMSAKTKKKAPLGNLGTHTRPFHAENGDA